MKQPIAITGIGSISSLGHNSKTIWKSYQDGTSAIAWQESLDAFTAPLSEASLKEVNTVRKNKPDYLRLDPSTIYALYAARKAVAQAGWKDGDFGINIGSSRGATQLFEKYYDAFKTRNIAATLTSPSTTLGNISSWVAQDLKSTGPDISHSITCSTALHALLNGVAWLQSGMASKFVVGGTEAALTPFTIAQMKAMKLTPLEAGANYPCQALNLFKKKNTMVLGEGAAIACLETGQPDNVLAYITGVGYATEAIEHAVSLSANGDCFKRSMQMALDKIDPTSIDAIVMHAPGTIQGDQAELEAIKTVFDKESIPKLTTNKWKIGHTFGASGLLNVELALAMIEHKKFIGVPYTKDKSTDLEVNTVLVNTVGFGGNAVSIVVSKNP